MLFENAVVYILAWTEKTMLSENVDVIKIDTTERQTTRPWVSKVVDKGYSTMRTEGIKAFSNGYGVVVWTGENDTKTISVDANRFENGAKQLRFRLKTD